MLTKTLVNVNHFCKLFKKSPKIFMLIYLSFCNFLSATITLKTKQINETTYNLTITFNVKPPDFVYQEYIIISTDSPSITLSTWNTSVEPISRYDILFKQTKKIFNQPFTLTLTAHTLQENISRAYLHIMYYQYSDKKIRQKRIPLELNNHKIINNNIPTINTKLKTANINPTQTQTNGLNKYLPTPFSLAISPLLYMLIMLALSIVLKITLWIYVRKIINQQKIHALCILASVIMYVVLIITPWHIASWIIAILILNLGIFYLPKKNNLHQIKFYRIKTMISMITIALSVFLFAKAWQSTYKYQKNNPTLNKLMFNAVF